MHCCVSGHQLETPTSPSSEILTSLPPSQLPVTVPALASHLNSTVVPNSSCPQHFFFSLTPHPPNHSQGPFLLKKLHLSSGKTRSPSFCLKPYNIPTSGTFSCAFLCREAFPACLALSPRRGCAAVSEVLVSSARPRLQQRE